MDKITLLMQYLEETPDDPFLHFALAKEFENQGAIDAAIEKYEYLMNQHTDYVGTYYHAGKIYESALQWEKALDCYSKGLLVAGKAKDRHSASELAGAKEQLESTMDL